MLDSAQKWLLILGAFMGFMSFAAGAFGAHALKDKLGSDLLSVFEVGARYQMYHALAIFAAVWISTIAPNTFSMLSGWFFLAGTVVFSGSLYLLALTGIRILGAVTPIGGVIMLLGWLFLTIAVYKVV